MFLFGFLTRSSIHTRFVCDDPILHKSRSNIEQILMRFIKLQAESSFKNSQSCPVNTKSFPSINHDWTSYTSGTGRHAKHFRWQHTSGMHLSFDTLNGRVESSATTQLFEPSVGLWKRATRQGNGTEITLRGTRRLELYALFHGWHFVLVHVPRTEKVKWYYATLLFIKVRRKGDHNSIIYRVRNVLDCSRVTRLEEIHLSKMHSRKIPLLRKNQAVFVLVGPSHPQRCCHKKQMLILPVVDYKWTKHTFCHYTFAYCYDEDSK